MQLANPAGVAPAESIKELEYNTIVSLAETGDFCLAKR
jgi:hypothetical protein